MTWRQRRKLSYLVHESFSDSNLPYKKVIQDDESIKQTVLDFFYHGSELIYPAKSYFVALIYAKLLSLYFDISFMEALDADDLLIDDPCFIPYSKHKTLYDSIMKDLPDEYWLLPSAKTTTDYFGEEFLIGADL